MGSKSTGSCWRKGKGRRSKTGSTPEEVRSAVKEIGFPVLIRPSYVLGGRGMEILTNDTQLDAYMSEAYIAPDKPLLADEYLGHAIELDVDAVSDGDQVLIGAIMEHLEEAGIHSGDSTCFIPPQNVSDEILDLLELATESGAAILMSTHNFPLIQPRKKRFIELSEGRLIV